MACTVEGTAYGGLGGLLSCVIGSIGSIRFILDEFDANYNCVPGKTNSVAAPGP